MQILVVIIILVVSAFTHQEKSDTIRLVSVFFRHGARTTELEDDFPSNPYKYETILPMGWGQLTNDGKKMAYTLGKQLRKRYDYFLGDIVSTRTVYAHSTDYDRTIMSAQLVLAGLFPPSPSQVWDEELKWLPFPVAYNKRGSDFVYIRPDEFCPKYIREHKAILQSEEVQAYLKDRKELFEYISSHAGKTYREISEAFQLFQIFSTQIGMNMTLPEWAKKVFPAELTAIAVKRGQIENFTPSLRRLNGGRLLQKVVKNMIAKTTNSLDPKDRKFFLYSGHDYFLVNVLSVLDLYEPHFPNYSSAVTIELHYLEQKNQFAVKILYLPGKGKDIEEKQLKGCDILCPFDKFLEITKPLIPGNYTAECASLVNLE